MAPEKSPAFQFYPKDFLSDENQSAMTLPEVGAYARLMAHCWLEGSLPDDPGRLGRLCGASKIRMTQLWPAIAPCFRQREDGRWVHPRLEKERTKQATFRQRATDGGIAKAARQAATKQTGSSPEAPAHALPNPALLSPISDLPSPISREREHAHADEEWVQFQAAYPAHRREGGYLSQQGFVAVCSEIGFPTLMARLDQQKRTEDWKKGMVPGMANYFLRQLWRQEPATADDQQADQIAAARRHMQDTADRKAAGRR